MTRDLPSLGITGKALLYLFLMSIAPLIIAGFTVYELSRTTLQEAARGYTRSLIDEYTVYIDRLCAEIEGVMANIAGVESVRDVLSAEQQPSDDYTRLATRAQIGYILSGYTRIDGLVSIDILARNGTYFHIGDTLDYESLREDVKQRIVDAAEGSQRGLAWLGIEDNVNATSRHHKVITAVRRLTERHIGPQKTLAYLVVNYDVYDLHQQFERVDLGPGAFLVITDVRGRIIYHTDKAHIGHQLGPRFRQRMTADQGSFVDVINGRDMAVTYRRSQRSGWLVTGFIPTANLAARAQQVRDSTLLVLAACLVFIVVLGYLFARSMVSPLLRLTSAFKHIRKHSEDWSVRVNIRRRDEIGELASSFNHMAADLETKHALLVSKEYVEDILNTMTNALFVIDQHGTIERVNRSTCALLGRGERGLIGQPLRAFLSAPDGDGDHAHIARAVIRGQARNVEGGLHDSEGRAVPVALSSAVMSSDAGSAQKIVCVAEDISARRELFARLVDAKRAAEQADHAKSAFLAHMSHELRTPLNGIMGYAQLLLIDDALLAAHRESVAIMYRSSEHLLTLLNDILDISKIEAGRMELHLSVFDLAGLIDNIADIVRGRAVQKSLRFSCRLASDVPRMVRGDERRLRQILINLLGNAIKFTRAGSVVLDVAMVGDRARFRVEDTGIGIAAEDLARIRAPFHQVGSPHGSVEGTGLGLAITHRLLGLMGSEFTVESDPGRGSVFAFELELPAVDDPEISEVEPTQAISGYRGRRRTVLIVDDNADNRAILAGMLAPLGFSLVEAADGRAALAEAARDRPDIILMDIRMPDLNGLEATRHIRRSPELDGVVIIAVSGSAFEQNHDASLAAGCDGFVAKPVRRASLLAAIERYAGISWLQDDADSAAQAAEIAAPPALIGEFSELARRGDIGGILDKIAESRGSSGDYRAFFAQLSAMADRFDIKRIQEFIASHVEAGDPKKSPRRADER